MRSVLVIFAVTALLSIVSQTANAEDVLRDPTRPWSARPVAGTSAPSQPGGVASYRVTAIFTSDQRRVAVVNGQRVIEGDRVDGATVVEIMADSLRLERNGKVITTRVLPYGFRS